MRARRGVGAARPTRWTLAAACALAAPGAAGCDRDPMATMVSTPAPKATPPPLPAPATESVPEGPAGPWEGATTPGDAWVEALRARRATVEARVAARPDDVDARIELADLLADLAWTDGDLDQLLVAERQLDQALIWRPGDDAVLRRRDALQHRLGRLPTLAVETEMRHLGRPDDPALARAHAYGLWEAGQYRRAGLLLDALDDGPRTPDEAVREARIALERGDAERADRLLRRAHLAVEGDSPLPRARLDHERGRVRLRTGRHAEARAFLEAALRRLPADLDLAEDLARVEARLGYTDAALRRYDDVVARSGRASALTARARLLKQRGDAGADAAFAAADAAWREAIDLSPYLYLEGAVRFWVEDRPDPERATRWSRSLKELRPSAVTTLLTARAQVLGDETRWARQLVAEARRQPVRSAEYFLELAAAEKALGDDEAARRAFAEARALDPTAEPPAGLSP